MFDTYSTLTFSSLISFILLQMGIMALMFGAYNLMQNRRSKSVILMFNICICVFFWDFGYAWMSLCYDANFAYIPRAIALLAIIFYMFYTLRYVAQITDYPKRKLWIFLSVVTILSLVSWCKIIQRDAVSFVATPWGFWYTSKMSWGRSLQFACNIACLFEYYVILRYGRRKAYRKRDEYVLKHFAWFGPILTAGYLLDTIVPSAFQVPAIPGSSISAFFSAMILLRISQRNKTFGPSEINVSEYVFRDVKLPVIITDSFGKIVLYNNATKKLLACEDKELMQRNLAIFFQTYEQGMMKVVGTEKICKMDKTDVKDDFDELLYSIYFVQDVTKEQENRRMLEESRAVAEEASRAKSNFLANMSHEIRTPMNAIIGMSEIVMQDTEISEKTMSQVNEIYNAGNHLLGIINDILDILKIEAGKYELVSVDYELPGLINDVSSIISVKVQETNLRFLLDIDPTLPRKLVGDENRVRQVLLNILGNAAKFTQKGSITLSVFWNHNESDARIYFDVTDTGIGIKPEDLDKIFGEFNQVDTRRNRNIQGTGLGLAISKHLVELMDGQLTVESEYGKGSTFHIDIRQEVRRYTEIGNSVAEALQNHQYSTILRNKQIEIIPRPNAKILIVDDTRLNLLVAKGVMKKYEMQIDTADSGMKAIEMVQQKDYDIVFMDHMMPEMDGVDTTRRIRALGGKYEKLTIIALSANVITEAKTLFLEEGMQDILCKPIEMKALDEIINKWLPVE